MEKKEEQIRSIPSLDGLRALSVLVVILGHTHSSLLDRIPGNASFRNGGQGVGVFFVISGFLITHLLLKELGRQGTIGLGRFYLRRTFRIFPPFYVFLLVTAILGLVHIVKVSRIGLLVAATYTWNYIPMPETWILGHCWSLTLEEQFYLLWPACMAFLGRRASFSVAAGVILLSPLSRVATYFFWPSMRGHINMMLHTHLDTLMMGCLLALAIDMNNLQKARKLALHPAVPIAAVLFLIAIDTPADRQWKGMYFATVGISLENVAIAGILLHAVFRERSLLARVLNLKPLRHLGAISYSTYLWQQLFTGPHTYLFPLNIVWIVACAEVSYLLVERPSFRLRDLVEQRILSGWNSAKKASPLRPLAESRVKDATYNGI